MTFHSFPSLSSSYIFNLSTKNTSRNQTKALSTSVFISTYFTRPDNHHFKNQNNHFQKEMHGQRRDEYKARLKDETTAKKLEKKALTWNKISAEIVQQRKILKQSAAADLLDANDHVNAGEGADAGERSMVSNKIALGLTEKLLSVNPDPSYLWNHRRDVLLAALNSNNDANNNSKSDTDVDVDGGSNGDISPSDFIQQEQILTQTALERNPKAYGAWFHRKWSIRHYLSTIHSDGKFHESVHVLHLLKSELVLCGEFLMLDERNFHCWNYRRFVVGTLMTVLMNGINTSTGADILDQPLNFDGAWNIHGLLRVDDELPVRVSIIGAHLTCTTSTSCPVQTNAKKDGLEDVHKLLRSEFDFTTEKIEHNFSNGSAFHQRSKLLPLLLQLDSSNSVDSSTAKKASIFERELELVRNAVFTEPDDQTSWWYFRFILDWANPQNDQGCDDVALENFQNVLHEEWQAIQELVESENGQCKWGLLGLHMIASTFCSIEESNHFGDQDWNELAKSCLMDLKVLDPDRSRRYDALMED